MLISNNDLWTGKQIIQKYTIIVCSLFSVHTFSIARYLLYLHREKYYSINKQSNANKQK